MKVFRAHGDATVRYFLIIFDHARGHMVGTPREFTDEAAAAAAYEQAEAKYQGRRKRIEVLLVGSDSLKTVARTHGLFFGDSLDAMDELFAAT